MKFPDTAYESRYWRKGELLVSGVDEVGRGSIAGPVVAACVLFASDTLIIEGIADSKLLSTAKRELLSLQIKQRALRWKVSWVSAKVIDRDGIVRATMMAMRRSINGCMPLDVVLIDGNRVPKRKNTKVTLDSLVQGDRKCYSIAAASIIAKVHRDTMMARYAIKYPDFGFEKHMGYGTKDHFAAIDEMGISPIHRDTFLS